MPALSGEDAVQPPFRRLCTQFHHLLPSPGIEQGGETNTRVTRVKSREENEKRVGLDGHGAFFLLPSSYTGTLLPPFSQ